MIDSISVGIGVFIGWFFGEIDGFIYVLLACCFMDQITGLFAAGVKHELSSNVGFNGIARKITIFVLVGFANIIDEELLGHTALFNDTALIRNSVIFFYITNEGISILENAVVIGIPVPDFLTDKLLEFRDKKIRQKRKIKKKC